MVNRADDPASGLESDTIFVGRAAQVMIQREAGRQAFLVLTYGLEDFDKDGTFESTNADLSLKFNYTFRF